jgi:hypothetical protein
MCAEFIALASQRAGNSTFFSGLFVRDSGRVEVMGHDMSRMLRNLELKAGENVLIEGRALTNCRQ